MDRIRMKPALLIALLVVTFWAPSSGRVVAQSQVLTMASIATLAFGPDGTLFAADNQNAAIVAFDLGAQASGATAGAKGLDALDEKLAAMLGTGASDITITDLAVHPVSHNSFIAVMRGQGNDARPALLRVDGAGKLALVSLETVKFTSVVLPNPAAVSPNGRGGRTQSVTDMSLVDGRLFVAGLSNEEFASKLWSVAYPFAKSIVAFATGLPSAVFNSAVMFSAPGDIDVVVEDVLGAGGAVEEVPRLEDALAAVDEQPAFPGQNEERLLLRLEVVEAVRLARQHDADVDAELPERELVRLEHGP